MTSSSPIVVLTASSRTGTQAVKTLLESGSNVRAAARNMTKLESLKSLGAETVEADLSQPETIKAALKEGKFLFFINPPVYSGADMFEEATRVAKVLAEALKGSDIKRVVLLSSIGAEQSEGTGNIGTTHILEGALKGFSNLEIVLLRCAYFVENWASVASLALAPPHILPTLALPLDRAIPQVSTQDIGKIAAKYLTIPSSSLSPTGPTIVQLSGPRDVSPIDIAATFEKIGGKKVTAVGVEDKDFESTLEKQVPIHVAANLSEMMRGINSSKINWVEGENVVQEKGSTEIEVTLREMAV